MEISSVTGMQAMSAAEMAAMRQAMFAQMDANSDGVLDASELADMATKVGTNADQIITDGDTDGDGMLSQTEMEELEPKGPPPPDSGAEMGGKLFESDSEDRVQELLNAIVEASEEEDSSTTIKNLIAEFIDGMESQQLFSGDTTGLLVNTTA